MRGLMYQREKRTQSGGLKVRFGFECDVGGRISGRKMDYFLKHK